MNARMGSDLDIFDDFCSIIIQDSSEEEGGMSKEKLRIFKTQ